jgi:hypothetical protein
LVEVVSETGGDEIGDGDGEDIVIQCVGVALYVNVAVEAE